jgi:hypothetical protein
MGRLIMAMTMLKYDFVPLVLYEFNKKDYVNHIVLAQGGDSNRLYNRVVEEEEYLLHEKRLHI